MPGTNESSQVCMVKWPLPILVSCLEWLLTRVLSLSSGNLVSLKHLNTYLLLYLYIWADTYMCVYILFIFYQSQFNIVNIIFLFFDNFFNLLLWRHPLPITAPDENELKSSLRLKALWRSHYRDNCSQALKSSLAVCVFSWTHTHRHTNTHAHTPTKVGTK